MRIRSERNAWNFQTRVRIQGQEAFTLVEIIIVIMLMGVLSAMIIPKVGNLVTDMRLKVATDKLKDDLTYIYDYAVARHDTTWLVVDAASNSYALYVGPSQSARQLLWDPARNAPALINLGTEYGNDIQVTAVNFGGGSEFFFNWWGTPSSGGQVVLNGIRSVNVVPETGYVY